MNDYLKSIPLYQKLYGDTEPSTFPILERKQLTQSFPHGWMTSSLQDAIHNDLVEYTTTSGSYGDRLQIVRPKNWWLDEHARAFKYIPGLVNFNVKRDKRAVLSTVLCSNTNCFREATQYSDRIINHTLFLNTTPDPNQWSETEIKRIVEELHCYQPFLFDADPVYLAIFIRKANAMGIDLQQIPFRCLSLDYEFVTNCARRYIEQFMHTQIINLYGTTEVGCLFFEVGQQFSRCPELSQIDFIPAVAEKNIYEIIVTSFKNCYMPFIRYRVGDLVRWQNNQVTALLGRAKDAIRINNDIVTVGEVDHSIKEVADDLIHYQLQVFNNQQMTFCYTTAFFAKLDIEKESILAQQLTKLFEKQITISVQYQDQIAPEASGKFALIKHLTETTRWQR